MTRDHGLDTLLDLDGTVIDQGGGYWIKVEAMRVQVSLNRPHGIKYSLSLHDPSGNRIMGYDNAHASRDRGRRHYYSGQKYSFDHRHRHASDRAIRYEFSTPYQLLEDFFSEADEVLKSHRRY